MTEPPGAGRGLVITPTYNERDNLPRLVPAILQRDARLDVLIIDDASPDGTGDLANAIAAHESRVHVMHRAGKLGLGTAYIAGFRWGIERGYEWLFEMDADFSHDPAHLPRFIEALRTHDVVLGSRYLEGRVTVVNWPMGRLLLSWFANAYARRITGLPIADVTSGYKAFRRTALEAVDLTKVESEGYAFQIEMTLRAWKRGARIIEVPIVFTDRTSGVSKNVTAHHSRSSLESVEAAPAVAFRQTLIRTRRRRGDSRSPLGVPLLSPLRLDHGGEARRRSVYGLWCALPPRCRRIHPG